MEAQIDYILFLYGLALIFVAAASFALHRTPKAVLSWQLLGLFGSLYGLNVWLEFFANAFGDPRVLQIMRLALVFMALLALTEFARSGHERLGLQTPGRWILWVLGALALAGAAFGFTGLAASVRYLLGVGGGLWAGATIWRYRALKYPGNPSLALLATSMMAFGLLAGFIVPPAACEPARSINTVAFLQWTTIPVQLFRGAAALCMGASLWLHSRLIVRREYPDINQTLMARFGGVIVGIIVIVVILGWVATDLIGTAADRELRAHLVDRTELVAAAVNPDRVQRLSLSPADHDRADYVRLREQMALITASAADVRWTYLMVERGGEILIAVDSTPSGEPGHSEPGDPYLEPPSELRDVLMGDVPGIAAGPYTDEYGAFVSGFAPIRDPQTDRVLGVAGLDIDASGWARLVATRRLSPIGITLVIIMMLLGFLSVWDRLRAAGMRLAESEGSLRAITDTAMDAIVLIDAQGTVTFWNRAAADMFGFETQEAMGRTFPDDMLAERHRGRFLQGLAGLCVETEDVSRGSTVEFSGLHRNGREFPVEITVAPVRLAHAWHAVAVMRDITTRRQMLEELQGTRDALNTIIQAAPVGIVSLDLNERVRLWNPAAEEMTGWTAAEVLGELIPWVPEEQHEDSDRLKKLWLQGEMIQGIELVRKRRDGSPLQISLYSAPLRDAAGNLVGDIGIFVDISERKQAEEALARAREKLELTNRQLASTLQRANQLALEASVANAAKSEFLANMSHEIRTPMNGVIGMTGLLLDTSLTAEQRDFAETIRRSADALLTVINDILDFSKIEAGKLEFEDLDFDLRTTLDDVADLLALRAQEKGLELALLIDAEVPSLLRGDPGRLRQVLTNLIGNAIKFTEKGEVAVTVSLAEGVETGSEPPADSRVETSIETALLRFEVRDTGIGIALEQLEHLFQPFTQADPSTTRRYGGTGLGLAISKQLVERMEGDIGATSSLGRGSTFWFTARFITREAPTITGTDDLTPLGIAGQRVLAVDDNATNRKVLAGMLEAWGCRHREVEDADLALTVLNEATRAADPYKAVILDMVMPDCDGEMLGARIKAQPALSQTPLIMMTSMGSRGDASRLAKMGFAAYLTKPVKQSHLYNCLIKVINNAERGVGGTPCVGDLITRHSLAEERKRHLRILVAEDNAINRKVALKTLEKMGFRAEAVANGWEALRALEILPYDLVLMDIQMPDMDGLEAASRIRDPNSRVQNHQVPIVALTAHAMTRDREKAIAAGMNDYLVKPVKPEELSGVITRLLSGEEPDRGGEEPATSQAVASETAASPADNHIVYDRRVLLGMLGGDERLARQIVDEFLREVEEQVTSIQEAIAKGAFEELKRAAHRLKGTAANVGAMALRSQAVRLEAAAGAEDSPAAASLASGIALALQSFRAEVEVGP